MVEFTYAPLVHNQEFRLLDILPGTFETPIRIALHHDILNRESPPPYEALSYTWGSLDNRTTVELWDEINAQLFSARITQNLACALMHLRRSDSKRTVWVDAVCINQSDIPERTKQVSMMGEVYRLASRVVAFLGPAEIDCSTLINQLQYIQRVVNVDFVSGSVTSSNAEGTSWANLKHAAPLSKGDLTALYHLIHCQWFERLWIRQEIGCGQDRAILLYGQQEITWATFCIAVYLISRKPLPGSILKANTQAALRYRLDAVDTVVLTSKSRFSFCSLRREIGYAHCQDPRDRIFAVLSQLDEFDEKLNIIPNYEKTAREVYIDVAVKNIRYNDDLYILNQCELREGTTIDLPSWVLDYSTPITTSNLHFVGKPFFGLVQNASLIDGDVLRTSGIRCGIINKTNPVTEGAFSSGMSATIKEIRRLFPFPATPNNKYPSGESILEAYCATICADSFLERWYPLRSESSSDYDSYQMAIEFLKRIFSDEIDDLEEKSLPSKYLGKIQESCKDRTFFTMDDGHFGLAPATSRPEDEVAVIFGSTTPIVVRRDSKALHEAQYRIVGKCYAHGLMQGQSLMGELPQHIWDVNDGTMTNLRMKGYINRSKADDIVREEDPRMKPFLSTLVEKGLLRSPSLEILRQAGPLNVFKAANLRVQNFNFI
ncbi:heterokaryon incompatibility protein-domain-containing protein [Xylaria sp. FL0933]|nr:heterokaryon incompatibility protein-domain-containing protein [Xylaria sp. FL0933]